MNPNSSGKRGQPRAGGKSGGASLPGATLDAGQRAVQERNVMAYTLASKMTRVTILSLIVAILGIGIGVLGWMLRPTPTYFAVDANGRLVRLQPMYSPTLGPSEVTNWAANAVTNAISIDFLRYRDELARVEPDFTHAGFDQYILALKNSGNLQAIVQNRYVVNATLKGSPLIVQDGTSGGRYFWRIKIPLVVGYHSGASTQTQDVDAMVTVIRVKPGRNPRGIAIQQLVLQQQAG